MVAVYKCHNCGHEVKVECVNGIDHNAVSLKNYGGHQCYNNDYKYMGAYIIHHYEQEGA